MSTLIEAQGMRVEFPIMNASHRSLKKSLLSAATGGRIATESARQIVHVTALADISLRVSAGERVALVGHNGSGKSTLLRALAGVYTPTAGTLRVSGSVSSLLDMSLGMDAEATGEENILLRGTLMGLRRSEIEQRFDAIAAFADLGDFLRLPIRTYSSGMLLRLSFAISTCVCPDILLIDEWLSVGDENFSRKASARIQELIEATGVLVLATHSMALVQSLCTRCIRLEHGSISADDELPSRSFR